MSKTIPLTHFPILISPAKFNLFTKFPSCSISFSSPKSSISCYFLSGKYPVSIDGKKRRLMVMKVPALTSEDGDENMNVLDEQEVLPDGSSKFGSPEFESTLNRSSKWALCVVLIGVFLWRRDAEAIWTNVGAVMNSILCVALKRILNQGRPIANLRLDPGMPSNHGQSIFYVVTYFILSMFQAQGVNKISMTFSVVILALGSHFSWLRVSQRFHTMNQVMVGAVLGSCFSIAWLRSWNVVVSEQFNSNTWVRVSILMAFAICCLIYMKELGNTRKVLNDIRLSLLAWTNRHLS